MCASSTVNSKSVAAVVLNEKEINEKQLNETVVEDESKLVVQDQKEPRTGQSKDSASNDNISTSDINDEEQANETGLEVNDAETRQQKKIDDIELSFNRNEEDEQAEESNSKADSKGEKPQTSISNAINDATTVT